MLLWSLYGLELGVSMKLYAHGTNFKVTFLKSITILFVQDHIMCNKSHYITTYILHLKQQNNFQFYDLILSKIPAVIISILSHLWELRNCTLWVNKLQNNTFLRILVPTCPLYQAPLSMRRLYTTEGWWLPLNVTQ